MGMPDQGRANSSIYKTLAGEHAVMVLYDSLLARWPVPYEAMDIPTRYGKTFVIGSGDTTAPALVLLHGAGTNSIMWAGDIEAYSRHYRVYAVDLPGEPGKSTPNRLDWTSPAYAEWLADVFAALQIGCSSLIGFSQGGWTALKFSISHPEQVRKLVLLSPGGIAPDKLSFVLKAIPLSMLGERGIRQLNRLLSGGQDIPPEVDQALTVITTHFKPRVAPLPIFTDQELQCLNMPVLVLMGDRDALRDGQKINARLKKQVTNVQTATISGGGHALFNTTGKILPFLGRTADG